MPARRERRPTSPPTLIPGAQARRAPITPDRSGRLPTPPASPAPSQSPATRWAAYQNQRTRARRRPALEVRTSPSPTEGLLCNCHLARPRRCHLPLYARHRRSRWWSCAASQAPEWRRSLVVHKQARGRRSRIRGEADVGPTSTRLLLGTPNRSLRACRGAERAGRTPRGRRLRPTSHRARSRSRVADAYSGAPNRTKVTVTSTSGIRGRAGHGRVRRDA